VEEVSTWDNLFCTQLPAVRNPALLRTSSNPRLERIILNPNANHHHHHHNHAGNPVVGTNLFLMEASKWQRSSELIRAGTNILHTRVHTMGTVCVSDPGRRAVMYVHPGSPYQYPLPNIPSHFLERQISVYYSTHSNTSERLHSNNESMTSQVA
jgi:hypothetical protein